VAEKAAIWEAIASAWTRFVESEVDFQKGKKARRVVKAYMMAFVQTAASSKD
jgi:hypothetical protein